MRCVSSCSSPRSAEPPANHAELTAIYEADQAARSDFQPGSMTYEEVLTFQRADSLRRVQVDSLLAAGVARTADDYYHAAMVFQHGGDTTSYRRAHDLATRAVELDSTHASARWLTAASWDRLLMQRGEPQWYGTQYRFDGETDAYQLYEVDTTRVTDADRQRLGIPTLAEARAQANSLNAQLADAQ